VTVLFAPTGAGIALRRLAGVRLGSRGLLKNGIRGLSEVLLLMLPGYVRLSFRFCHEETVARISMNDHFKIHGPTTEKAPSGPPGLIRDSPT
jgi:hypothetical protein